MNKWINGNAFEHVIFLFYLLENKQRLCADVDGGVPLGSGDAYGAAMQWQWWPRQKQQDQTPLVIKAVRDRKVIEKGQKKSWKESLVFWVLAKKMCAATNWLINRVAKHASWMSKKSCQRNHVPIRINQLLITMHHLSVLIGLFDLIWFKNNISNKVHTQSGDATHGHPNPQKSAIRKTLGEGGNDITNVTFWL